MVVGGELEALRADAGSWWLLALTSFMTTEDAGDEEKALRRECAAVLREGEAKDVSKRDKAGKPVEAKVDEERGKLNISLMSGDQAQMNYI